MRAALEGRWEHTLASGARLVPSAEVGVRHDGGDAERGSGLEAGGGLSWTDPALGLTVDAKGRALVEHRDEEFREWGAGVSVRLDPGADGRGLSFSLAPSWGAEAGGGGVERLWEGGTAGPCGGGGCRLR